jgi:hypothetical protein
MLLERLLFRTGVFAYLRRQWRDDQQQASGKVEARIAKSLQAQSARIESTVALQRHVERLERQVQDLRATALFNAQHRERRHGEDVFDASLVAAHVARSIAAASLDTDPMPHMVIANLVPEATYAALLDGIPPHEFFSNKDPKKQNFRLSSKSIAPEWTCAALGFLEGRLIPELMVPALRQAFASHMQSTYASSYGPELGPQVARLPHVASAGRLMLRRRGYHLDPHLDPRRVVVTCLIYFARPGDSEAFGTTFFRIDGDPVVDRRNTFYPEEHGLRCTFVKAAPFRPNTAVAFLNAGGAHGADIPKTAPADTERYSYQFYVSPEPAALAALLGEPETPAIE